ncbi:hypothetical protein KAR48_08955 [bacterium]|nr:hypothetical protein [bacterium]
MSNSNKWLTGCGIGCGTTILILTILIGVGYMLIRSSIRTFQYAEKTQEELLDKYGDVRDYTPPLDGYFSPERLENFLAVRAHMASSLGEIELKMGKLDQRIDSYESGERANIWNILDTVGKGLGAIPQLAEYIKLRNEALLENDMSLGEYSYLYIVIYYAWLEKPLSDGPRYKINIDGWGEYSHVSDEDVNLDEDEVYIQRRDNLTFRSRRLLRSMLENQLEAIKIADSSDLSEEWYSVISDEIKYIRANRDHIPWSLGLPAPHIHSFEAYREKLNASYVPLMNPLELMNKFD